MMDHRPMFGDHKIEQIDRKLNTYLRNEEKKVDKD